MLLLLLLGAGASVPVVAGVRAYANISYAIAGGADASFALVNPTSDSLSLTTNAYATEE